MRLAVAIKSVTVYIFLIRYKIVPFSFNQYNIGPKIQCKYNIFNHFRIFIRSYEIFRNFSKLFIFEMEIGMQKKKKNRH